MIVIKFGATFREVLVASLEVQVSAMGLPFSRRQDAQPKRIHLETRSMPPNQPLPLTLMRRGYGSNSIRSLSWEKRMWLS